MTDSTIKNLMPSDLSSTLSARVCPYTAIYMTARTEVTVMPDRCTNCGVFQRVAINPSGEYWLCTNCRSEDDVIGEVKDIIEALDLTRTRSAAYAFGIVDAEFEDNLQEREATPASAVYIGSILADDEAKLTQKEVAEVADVGVTTIREYYPDVYEGARVEVDGERLSFEDYYGPIKDGERNPPDPHDWFEIEDWRESLGATHTNDAAKSAASHVRRFAVWYAGDSDPTVKDVEEFLSHLVDEEYAPSTIEGRYDALRKYFEWADAHDLSEIDITEYVTQAWKAKVQ